MLGHPPLLEIVKASETRLPGPSLMTMCRDEMYYLPAFLDHYRKIGVNNFYLVDDRSVDGTREFLELQPDVTVLTSSARFEDKVSVISGEQAGQKVPAYILWRNEMLARFANEDWAFLVDVDEFIRLPSCLDAPGLIAVAEADGCRSVMGVMLDVYPGSMKGMRGGEFSPEGEWFFDAERHLKLRSGRKPKVLYGGSRARFMHQAGLQYVKKSKSMKWKLKGRRFAPYNAMHKPVLLKWRDGEHFHSAHDSSLPYSLNLLLPIMHFKFTYDTFRRVSQAIEEGNHFNASAQYVLLAELVQKMELPAFQFLYRNSRRADDFSAFLESGNALV